MHRRIEELAERVEEEDPRKDPGEDLEFGVMMFQMHEFVSHNRLEFVLVKKSEQTARDEDDLFLSPDGYR